LESTGFYYFLMPGRLMGREIIFTIKHFSNTIKIEMFIMLRSSRNIFYYYYYC
jgi:hypothetical protein